MSTKEPFQINVPDTTLQDLHDRLARTRWPHDFANDQWEYGTNLTYLKELVEYWRDQYDWRNHECEMNTFSHYKTTIEGIPIHFIHQPGTGPKPMPIMGEKSLFSEPRTSLPGRWDTISLVRP